MGFITEPMTTRFVQRRENHAEEEESGTCFGGYSSEVSTPCLMAREATAQMSEFTVHLDLGRVAINTVTPLVNVSSI